MSEINTFQILGITEKHKEKSRHVSDALRKEIRSNDFGYDYWDNPDFPGYQGYHYDGRWKKPAQELIEYYKLTSQSSVLDVGCGKAFLLYELQEILPGLTIHGIDISEYALAHAKEEIKEQLIHGSATDLPFSDQSMDLVISLAAIYTLDEAGCRKAIEELSRVGHKSLIQTVSYRNTQEKENMLSCDAGNMHKSIDEWESYYKGLDYRGDRSYFIFV